VDGSAAVMLNPDPLGPISPDEQRRRAILAAETVKTEGTAPPPAAAVPGKEVPHRIGRFQVRGLLGQGAFGTVYRAYDPQLDREVALKILQAGALDSPRAIERFQREARAAGRLHHPHIVPVYDVGSDGPHHFIASAFIAGWSLQQVIDEGMIDLAQAVRIVGALARALDYAHRQGVVHRDVKPANIMVDGEGEPYLLDFGLAYHQDIATRLTQHGAILGTPAYMAPEHAGGQGDKALPASDQYSLGVVLYELLCGKAPFSGPPAVVLYHAIHTAPPEPRSLNPHISSDLEAICLKAIRKRPEHRYGSCREFAEALTVWQQGQEVVRGKEPTKAGARVGRSASMETRSGDAPSLGAQVFLRLASITRRLLGPPSSRRPVLRWLGQFLLILVLLGAVLAACLLLVAFVSYGR